ncbi:MAG: beta strand repeat-containing protein, partial [Acidobacteriota bacterium]
PLNHIGASNFVNLPPVNSVPGAQNVNEDFALTFNAGNANLISISDPDANAADVKVTLTATNGTFSLSGVGGLAFTTGDGTADAQMIFTGTIANINTALNGLVFTPPANYFGPASLTILTDDQGNTGVGGAKTDSDTVNITVNAVNDPPSFTKGPNQNVNEDAGAQTVLGWATGISQGPGESGQTLTFNVAAAGTTGNIAFSSGPAIDATTGNLTYTTSPNTNGTATFNVTLSDNGSNVPPNSNTSGVQQFTITVNAVNDAPTFQILSNPPTVNEDAGAQTVNSFATNFQPGPPTATDEVGQTLVGYTLTQTGTTGGLTFSSGPSISNAGALTYTPSANVSGTATYNAVVTDSGSGIAPNVNQSAAVSFTITVTSQNDAPVLDNSGNMTLTAINEDVPNASNPGNLVSDVILSAGGDRITDLDSGAVEGIAVIAVDNTNGTWQFSIDNGLNWTAFGAPNATTARLLASDALTRVRFVPNANFNGTVDPGLTFRAWDQTSGTNGNTADTTTFGGITAFSAATETASITVNPVNDTPAFTKGPDQTVLEDAGAQVVNNWATGISAGPANEAGQALTFLVTGNTNPSLFAVLPAISATGNLTYAAAANANGSATITIALMDNGGT